jgi:hypothetical protein
MSYRNEYINQVLIPLVRQTVFRLICYTKSVAQQFSMLLRHDICFRSAGKGDGIDRIAKASENCGAVRECEDVNYWKPNEARRVVEEA